MKYDIMGGIRYSWGGEMLHSLRIKARTVTEAETKARRIYGKEFNDSDGEIIIEWVVPLQLWQNSIGTQTLYEWYKNNK